MAQRLRTLFNSLNILTRSARSYATETHLPYIPQTPQVSQMASLNVFKKPLALHSTQPMTGFLRNGYCEVPPNDAGNHSVAATVTDAFLDYSAKQGNDLRSIGLTGGCKWCLCVTRWKEAMLAAGKGDLKESEVPRVRLDATNERALGSVTLEELKKFSRDED